MKEGTVDDSDDVGQAVDQAQDIALLDRRQDLKVDVDGRERGADLGGRQRPANTQTRGRLGAFTRVPAASDRER